MAASLIILSLEIAFIIGTLAASFVLLYLSNRHNEFEHVYFYTGSALMLITWVSLFFQLRYRFRRVAHGDQVKSAELAQLSKNGTDEAALAFARDRLANVLPANLTGIYVLSTVGIVLIINAETFDLAMGIFLISITSLLFVILLLRNSAHDYHLLVHVRQNILAARMTPHRPQRSTVPTSKW